MDDDCRVRYSPAAAVSVPLSRAISDIRIPAVRVKKRYIKFTCHKYSSGQCQAGGMEQGVPELLTLWRPFCRTEA